MSVNGVLSRIAFLALLGFGMQSALASTSRTVRVEVPASTYQARTSADEVAAKLELQVASTAVLDGLVLPSWTESPKPFSTGVVPRIMIGYVPRLAETSWGELSLRLGVGFAVMRRTDTVDLGINSSIGIQNAFWGTATAGVEFTPAFLTTERFSMAVGLAGQPHLVSSVKSLLGDPEAVFGLGYEASLGASYRFKEALGAIGPSEVLAGATLVGVNLGSSSVGGLGFHGGFRWAL
jgi:hypothetical protein